jgi:hypothetical protein
MRIRGVAGLFFVEVVLAVPLGAAGPEAASWDKLKSLVGHWQGTFEGKPATVSYALISDGTALLETMENLDSSQMVSVYHPDGSSLLMTHYCSAGNQSRMRAEGFRDGKLAFSFVDATNVKSPDEHRMAGLVLTFPDRDHLVQQWTAKAAGQEHVARMEFSRRK